MIALEKIDRIREFKRYDSLDTIPADGTFLSTEKIFLLKAFDTIWEIAVKYHKKESDSRGVWNIDNDMIAGQEFEERMNEKA